MRYVTRILLLLFLVVALTSAVQLMSPESDDKAQVVVNTSLAESDGSVEGRVVNEHGVALGGVVLTPFRNPADVDETEVLDRTVIRRDVVSSEVDGRFYIDDLSPGRYFLRANFGFRRGFSAIPLVEFELGEQPLDLGEIRFPTRDGWTTYHGKLLDSEASPVVNKTATIEMRSGNRGLMVRTFSTGNSGEFTLFPYEAPCDPASAVVRCAGYRRTVSQRVKGGEVYRLRRDPASLAKTKKLTCQLLAETQKCKVNENVELRVRIKNESDSSIFLVARLDGSESQMRLPHCYLEIDGERSLIPRCGMMNSLTDSDFHEVGGRETFLPLDPLNPRNARDQMKFRKPGTYRLRYVYDTSEAEPSKWFGTSEGFGPRFDEYSAQMAGCIAAVSKVRLESNVVVIEVSE